jgi:hypothetical protein
MRQSTSYIGIGLGFVFRRGVIHAGLAGRRSVLVLGGIPNQQGEEAAQPIIGVGTWVGEDPDPADLRGVVAGSGPPVLSVPILRIGLVIRPHRWV